jgi:hypothetical protein
MLLEPNIPLGVNVDPLGKISPKLVPGKKPPRPNVDTKGKSPHCEKFPPRDVSPKKGVLFPPV